MSKLFEAPAIPRKIKFRMETYKGNRVALKIILMLRKGGVYKVKEIFEDKVKENRIFEISTKSIRTYPEALGDLKLEIISCIPDTFPTNYLFSFSGHPLGFKNSFTIESDELLMSVSHRIKEVKKGTKIPKQIIL